MTEAHGDAGAVAIVRAFRDRALQVLGPDDELVKTIGDAVMLRFPTPHAAVASLRDLLQRELVSTTPCGATITHVGSVDFRNVSEAIDVYDVRVGQGDEAVVTDPVCQMRVPTTGDAAIALLWDGRHLNFCGLPCVSRFTASPERYLDRNPGGRQPGSSPR